MRGRRNAVQVTPQLNSLARERTTPIPYFLSRISRVKNLIKQMDADVKEMTKLTTDIEKATIAVRKAYEQAGKQFK